MYYFALKQKDMASVASTLEARCAGNTEGRQEQK
jgi:hypothetical protein